jgi:hypothetical protein
VVASSGNFTEKPMMANGSRMLSESDMLRGCTVRALAWCVVQVLN